MVLHTHDSPTVERGDYGELLLISQNTELWDCGSPSAGPGPAANRELAANAFSGPTLELLNQKGQQQGAASCALLSPLGDVMPTHLF